MNYNTSWLGLNSGCLLEASLPNCTKLFPFFSEILNFDRVFLAVKVLFLRLCTLPMSFRIALGHYEERTI